MTLTTPMKIVLAVIIIAVIGLGFWMLDWQKKQTDLAGIEKTLQEKVDERQRIEKDVQKIDELVKENNELKGQLQEVVKTGFTPESETNFVPSYLEKVESLIERVRREDHDPSFDVLSITPGAQSSGAAPAGGKEKGKEKEPAAGAAPEALRNYPTRTFQMAMEGRYSTLVDFLDRLGRLEMQRLVTVNKLSLSPKQSGTANPTLSITLPLTAYLRTGTGGEQ